MTSHLFYKFELQGSSFSWIQSRVIILSACHSKVNVLLWHVKSVVYNSASVVGHCNRNMYTEHRDKQQCLIFIKKLTVTVTPNGKNPFVVLVLNINPWLILIVLIWEWRRLWWLHCCLSLLSPVVVISDVPWLTSGQFDWLGWQHGNQLVFLQCQQHFMLLAQPITVPTGWNTCKKTKTKPKLCWFSAALWSVRWTRDLFFSFLFLLTLTVSVQHFVRHRNPVFDCLPLLNFLSTHLLKTITLLFFVISCHRLFSTI